jgi:uncharacterized membrane protein SpoIIM required for sporulation
MVYVAIFLVGLLHRVLPYILYYYNSILFCFYLSISIQSIGLSNSLIKTLPHGLLEILSFAVITYIAGNKITFASRKSKNIYVMIGLFMLLLAAVIERFITPII